jgi:hypothetical protein
MCVLKFPMNSRIILLLVFATIFVSALAGCATSYPLGLTQSEWEALAPAKQVEYRALQKIKENQARQDAERRY